MIEKMLSELPNKDIFSLLQSLGKWIGEGAEWLKIAPAILYWVGFAVAIAVGLSCYKLMRLWLGLLGAVAGYYITGNGLMLFNAQSEKDVPLLWVYVIAIAVALGLFVLAFKSPTYVFYTVMAVAGFSVTYFYTQNVLLALLGALVLALICAFLMRVAFIVVSSLVGGTIAVSLLGLLFPRVDALQLEAGNWTAIGVVVGVSLVFAVFQFAVSMKKSPKKEQEEKPARAEREKPVEASLFSFN
ncbi:MAG: hypothetical protein IJW29_07715 [Clostridia bacterium]|nr:hypothetical protein [Clostridia bacterium]